MYRNLRLPTTFSSPVQVTVSDDYYIKIHRVGDAIAQGSVYTSDSFAVTGGSSLINDPVYIAVSPDGVGVRVPKMKVTFLACCNSHVDVSNVFVFITPWPLRQGLLLSQPSRETVLSTCVPTCA